MQEEERQIEIDGIKAMMGHQRAILIYPDARSQAKLCTKNYNESLRAVPTDNGQECPAISDLVFCKCAKQNDKQKTGGLGAIMGYQRVISIFTDAWS